MVALPVLPTLGLRWLPLLEFLSTQSLSKATPVLTLAMGLSSASFFSGVSSLGLGVESLPVDVVFSSPRRSFDFLRFPATIKAPTAKALFLMRCSCLVFAYGDLGVSN